MLNMTKVLYMDTTGVAYLSEVILHVLRYGGSVYLIGAQAQPLETLIKSGLGNREGIHHCHDLTDALRKATSSSHEQRPASQQHVMLSAEELAI